MVHIKYKALVVKEVEDPTNLDVLSKSLLLFEEVQSGWLYADCTKWKLSVHFLPIIDLSPSDITWVNSTLLCSKVCCREWHQADSVTSQNLNL